MPSFDNSPRRRRDVYVFIKSSPKLFHQWLVAALANLAKSTSTPPILFVNAWNEWAEGNHLEPDLKFGHAYLEVLRDTFCPP
jgi:lipopolysaccharide biosynthesis protein